MSDISQQEYQRRRQVLLAQMQPGSAALIFAAQEATRSADSEYPYRQSSDFWYFTGFNEPEAVLVLIKSDDTHNHSVLFNRVRDLTAEIWFGRRLGQDAAPEKLGANFSDISPGKKPRSSSACKTGRVTIILSTSLCIRASAAFAALIQVFPHPASPVAKISCLLSIAFR